MEPDWVAWPASDNGDTWETLAEIRGFAPPLAKRWYRVCVRDDIINFPLVCPHCLRPASRSLPVELRGDLSGYYLFYATFRAARVRVFFCDPIANRIKWAQIIWIVGFVGSLVVALGGGSVLHLSADAIQPLVWAMIAIAGTPMLFFNTRRFVRLLSTAHSSTDLAVRNKLYAQTLAESNVSCPRTI